MMTSVASSAIKKIASMIRVNLFIFFFRKQKGQKEAKKAKSFLSFLQLFAFFASSF